MCDTLLFHSLFNCIDHWSTCIESLVSQKVQDRCYGYREGTKGAKVKPHPLADRVSQITAKLKADRPQHAALAANAQWSQTDKQPGKTHPQTYPQTGRRYQVHHLPRFTVDNHVTKLVICPKKYFGWFWPYIAQLGKWPALSYDLDVIRDTLLANDVLLKRNTSEYRGSAA